MRWEGIWFRWVAVLALGILLGGSVTIALGANAGVISACFDNKKGDLRVAAATDPCDPQKETPLTWDIQGPKGDPGPQGPKGDPGPPGPSGGSPSLTAAALVGTWKIRHINTTTGQWEQVGEVTFSPNGTYTATPNAYTLGGAQFTLNGAPVTSGSYQVVDGSVLELIHQFSSTGLPGFPPPPLQTRVGIAVPVSVTADKIMHQDITVLSSASLEILAK